MSSLFQLAVGPATNITLVFTRHVFKVGTRHQMFCLAVGTLERLRRFKLTDRSDERAREMVSQHFLGDASGATLPTGEPKRRYRPAFAADENSIEHGALQDSSATPAFVNRVVTGQSILEEFRVERWDSGFFCEDQFADSAASNLAVDSVVANFVRSHHATGEQCSAIKRRHPKNERRMSRHRVPAKREAR